eukprot:830727-Heterocapsa_arctica.AAC.1
MAPRRPSQPSLLAAQRQAKPWPISTRGSDQGPSLPHGSSRRGTRRCRRTSRSSPTRSLSSR